MNLNLWNGKSDQVCQIVSKTNWRTSVHELKDSVLLISGGQHKENIVTFGFYSLQKPHKWL